MSDPEPPKLYLATPAQFDLSQFLPLLTRVLDTVPVACLRLALTTRDEDALLRAGDVLRDAAHRRDIPIVIADHYRLVDRLGLDGVHLTDGQRKVREVRRLLGKAAIVGAFCGTSRHAAMTAGEAGADYISFGPATAGDALGDGSVAAPEVFAWWAEVMELPVVAEGGVTGDALPALADVADFICLGEEIWTDPDGPVAAAARMSQVLDPA